MLVEKELEKGNRKQFIVLHTYGSHSITGERYPKLPLSSYRISP